MAIEIIDFNTKDYICTLKRESGNNYILTDRSNRAVGYCKEESSFPYQVASLELYWNDGTKFGTVERQLGMASSYTIDAVKIKGSLSKEHGGGIIRGIIEMEIPVNEVDDDHLLRLLFGYDPRTGDGGHGGTGNGSGYGGGTGTGGSTGGSITEPTPRPTFGTFLALIIFLGIIGLMIWAIKSCVEAQSSSNYPSGPSVTRRPSETDALATDDYIVDGVFYIKSVSDGRYIAGFGDKNNGKGVFGHYIEMVSDKSNALRFTPTAVEGKVCRLVTYDLPEGGEFYLDAFDSRDNDCSVDLWGSGTDRDQRWIVEKQKDGAYRIYLASDRSRCLTNLIPDDPGPQDELYLAARNADIAVYQEWYIVPADAAGFTPRPLITQEPYTLSPDEIETLATDDFVVDGTFYIKDLATRMYIGAGGDKKNSSGKIGRYIDLVYDKSDALRFTPVSVDGRSCRLVTYDIDGEPFYLDAYNSKSKNFGADLWKEGSDRDQRWILEKKEFGRYIIYLESDNSLCLTNLPSDDVNHDDWVSVRSSDEEFYVFQEWFLVLAD